MKKNQNISLAKAGMSRDLAVDSLDEQAYSIAINMNMENESGELYKLKSEHSNILASKFKDGFRVIGFEVNEFKNETLFLLVNPETGVSEIGKIKNNTQIADLSDVERECPECNYERVLQDPLEETDQPEHQIYETLLTDDCVDAGLCLNFNINYPVRRIVVKNEKLGTKWFWSDGLNPPRYLDESRLEEYKTKGTLVCGVDNTVETCIDCDKLRLFPQADPIKIEAESLNVGGSLKLGVYSFYVAYADQVGQVLSEYQSLTQPVSIFDVNKRIRTNEQAELPTNYAIKLNISGADPQYSYYKVIVAYTNAVDQGTRHFDLGLFPVTRNSILFDTTDDKVEVDVNTVLRPAQNIRTLNGVTEANNHLIGFGVTREKEWNLQPVVNLMGSFLKWSSYQALEDIYEDGVVGSKYKGYLRDEVYPLGIKFKTKSGYQTALFPFIGRPATANDTTVLSNTDVNSLNQSGLDCADVSRTQRWQVYNTATQEGTWPTGIGVDTNTITEPVTKNSITEITAATPGVSGISDGTYTFFDEADIIAITEASEEEAPSVFVTLINNAILSNNCVGDLCNVDTSGVPDLVPDYDPDTCVTPPEKVDDSVRLASVDISNIDITYASYPDEYSDMKITNFCTLYVTDPADGDPLEDTNYYDEFVKYDGSPDKAFVRTYGFSNDKPRGAERLFYADPDEPIQKLYHHNYAGSKVGYSDLEQPLFTGLTRVKEDGQTYGGNDIWGTNMTINALWWEIDLTTTPIGIIEIPPGINPGGQDDAVALDGEKRNRISFWNENNPSSPLTTMYSEIYRIPKGTKFFYRYYAPGVGPNLSSNPTLQIFDQNGDLIYADSNYNPGKSQRLYFALDPQRNRENTFGIVEYFVRPSNYCWGVAIREREIIEVNVDYQNIAYERVQRYVTPCDFEVPILGNCEALPYEYGSFAYWESTEEYPDNPELYDSSDLVVTEDDFQNPADAAKFQELFASGVSGGTYTLDETETNFICKPIRHFKFPDNKVSPFMYSNPQSGFTQSIVYPMGVHIDDTVIQDFLAIAENNGLITPEQRASIVEYEIYRGDRSLDKGVVARGLLYDMYKYEEQEKDIWFSNFPFNDLGQNRLFYEDDTRTTFIPHPGANLKTNDKYTFHSPETEFSKPSLPTDLKIEGYQFGKSRGFIEEVEGHPKYVILGPRARQLAKTLATLEVIAEAAIIAAESANVYRVDGGVVFSANPVGIGLNIAATALNVVGTAVYKYGRYKYQWEQAFRENGDPENFAYYYTSVGDYNYMQPLQSENNWVRGLTKALYLRDGRTVVVNEVGSEKVEINNVKREDSVFLTVKGTGANYELQHPSDYYNFDNSDVDRNQASRTYASDSSVCVKGKSPEIVKNISSPYVSLNNYLPSQYGTIDSINWLTTSYKGDLNSPSDTPKPIFGGDAYIARHTLKRKFPMFLRTAMGLSNFTPFNYRAYSNLGLQPSFYGNFLAPDEVTFDRNFPQIRSEFIFDCFQNTDSFYIKNPAKFYLYYYGIPSYLTETTINLNYRIGGPQPKDQFYPLFEDFVEWTQQETVSINEKNTYQYEPVFSSTARQSIFRTLPSTYDSVKYDTIYDSPNGLVYSRPDNNENSLTEPWLTFLPNDRYDFPTTYGQLVEVKGIEKEFVMCRFDNLTATFNAIDTIVDDGTKPETQNLGDGFKRRPVTFYETDLGYGGSQSADSISCELGHFFADAKRGQVFRMLPGAQGLEEISAVVNQKPSGMRNWFKSHLPFKVLSPVVENYEDINTDNPYNGIGIVMGWDSRHKRVFLTKKDYKPLKSMTYTDGEFFDGETKIELTNTEYFEDVSFTVAYSALTGTWISYYDFHPNYYLAHNNYFQTGINIGTADQFGLWSHLLTNKSFGVFYGTKHDVVMEYPIKNTFASKTLENIQLWTSGIRYHNEHDYAYNRDINFNKMYALNRREATGQLHLVPQKTLRDNVNYPKTFQGYQEILMTNTNDRWNVNYLFNRVKSEYNNQPIFNWDETQIRRTFNPNAVSFRGKRVLEPLRGSTFLVNLAYDTDSRFQVEFDWATNEENLR